MKPNIHPEYRPVAFVDLSINKTFIISSAVQTKETVEIDGVTYPLFKLDTSSESHPFYTGAQTRIVEAGRVEKFRAKYAHVTKSAKYFFGDSFRNRPKLGSGTAKNDQAWNQKSPASFGAFLCCVRNFSRRQAGSIK